MAIKRDDWVKYYQNPFDAEMARLPDYSPEELALVQEYQRMLEGADPNTRSGAVWTAFNAYPGYGFGGTPLSDKFASYVDPNAPALSPEEQEASMDPFALNPLEDPPMIDPSMGDAFTQDYMNRRDADVNAVGDLFGPETQFDLSQVPQPSAALLNESGYSPEIMAKLRAGAIDDSSRLGISRLAGARRTLGMGDSGAESAITDQIARDTGASQYDALRDIDIQNADVGLANQRTNIASLNTMAMENASRLFSAMSQNVNNSMAKSGAQTGTFQNATDNFNNASTYRKNVADLTNQNAQQRTNEMNFGAGEDRWRTALGALTNFSQPSFPQAPSYGANPLSGVLSNVGASFLDNAISNYSWGGGGSAPNSAYSRNPLP